LIVVAKVALAASSIFFFCSSLRCLSKSPSALFLALSNCSTSLALLAACLIKSS